MKDIAYGTSMEKGSEVEVELAGMKCECYVLKTGHVKHGPKVWLMVRVKDSDYYVVGLQRDGSIVRAQGCDGMGFPIDSRVDCGCVAIKQQLEVGE
jgi:hypothetical protein